MEMELDLSKEIIRNLANPTFPKNISSSTNKVFIKYSDNQIRRYNLDIIYNLCKNSNLKNKESLLYQTLIFHDLILYNCGNKDIIKDINLMILTAFYLSVKCIGIQFTMINIEQLKKLIPNKFSQYKNNEIIEMEILCLKLLKYNVNIITCYDCLKIILLNYSVNDDFSEKAKDLLQKIIFGDIKEYIFKLPYKLAFEIYEKVKFKLKEKTNIKVLNTEKRIKNNISIFSKSKINTLSSYNLKIQNKNIVNNNKGINSVSPSQFSINQNSSFISSNTKYEKKINNILSNCNTNIKKIYSSKSSLIEKPKNEIKNKIEINKKRVLKEINNNNYKNIIENKKSDEDNNKYCNTITINSLDKGHFNLDFKSLADIGKRIKLNSLKKCPE
jgi:hypothetical protein